MDMNAKGLEMILQALRVAKKALECPAGEFANIADKYPEKLTSTGDDRRKEIAISCINIAGEKLGHIVEMASMMEQAFNAGRASAGIKDDEDEKENEPAKQFGFAASRKGHC